MIGKTVSHYRITRELGSGAMGVVYKAVDTKLQRKVALKFLSENWGPSNEAEKRFRREARTISCLDHPNICTIYEIGEHEGRSFIAMAYYSGRTLREILDEGPLVPEQARDLSLQIAQGVAAAHKAEIVHRDLKPENILVTDDGLVKILDFGVALSLDRTRLTNPGSSVGTLAYMAPEQVLGEEVTSKADIWSLGVLVHEMLEGETPFKGEFEAALVYDIAHNEVDLKKLRDRIGSANDEASRLVALCEKTLVKNPGHRLQSMNDCIQVMDPGFTPGTAGLKTVSTHRFPTQKPLLLGLMLVVLVTAVSGWFLFGGPHASPEDIPSIAVLPLQNVSSNSEEIYFANGMTGEMISNLGKVDGLRVISRTSVMQYRETEKSLPEIARELGVKLILEGTVLQVGNQVKITAQLIDASKDELLWGESYTRQVQDILQLHDEVSLAIAEEILHTISPGTRLLFTGSAKVDPRAYELYLRGLNMEDELKLAESRQFLEQAIETDPEFSLAYSKLSAVLFQLGHWGWVPKEEAFAEARILASKALELDPRSAEAYLSLARLASMADWDWARAEEYYRKAAEIQPGTPPGTLYLMYRNRKEKCLEVVRANLKRSPRDRRASLELGYFLFYFREWEQAEAHFKTMIETWPDAVWPGENWAKKELGWVYCAQERYDQAYQMFKETGIKPVPDDWYVRTFVKAGHEEEVRTGLVNLKKKLVEGTLGLDPRQVGIWMAIPHFYLGETDSFKVWVERFESTPLREMDGDEAYKLAVLYTNMGRSEEALQWLKTAYELRAPMILSLLIDWELDPLRDHPEFQALVDKVGLR